MNSEKLFYKNNCVPSYFFPLQSSFSVAGEISSNTEDMMAEVSIYIQTRNSINLPVCPVGVHWYRM